MNNIVIIVSSLIMLLLGISAKPQSVVKGNGFSSIDHQTIYLVRFLPDMISSKCIDSTKVENGSFDFKLKEDTLNYYLIQEKNGGVIFRFYAEQGMNTITPAGLIHGTPNNERYWSIKNNGYPAREIAQVIDENIQNALGIYMLSRWEVILPKDYEYLYSQVNEKMKNYLPIIDLKEKIDSVPKTGHFFKEITAVDINQKKIKLSDIAGKGKYTMLYFIYAPHDNDLSPFISHINNMISEFNKDIRILVISNRGGSSRSLLEQLQQKFKDSASELYFIEDPGHYNNSIKRTYGLGSINYTFVISPDGKIM